MDQRWLRSLDDGWRAAPADDEVRRVALDTAYDDQHWDRIDVPGHWRTHATFAASDGPLLYRCGFDLDATDVGPGADRLWVVVDGVCVQADVWLDGAYLGDPEGVLAATAFDISALARLSADHVLAVEVSCPPQRADNRRTLTGALQASDVLPAGWNPGGLWRSVHLERTGPVRIDRWRVACRDVTDTRAHLRFHARLDADAGRTVELRTTVDGRLADVRTVSLATGVNEIDWNLDIADPDLWWPWSLGAQHLTHIETEVVVDGAVSHRAQRRTGLREVALQDWTWTVNRERLFVKGVAVAPTAADLAGVSAERIRGDVAAIRDAGLDLIRVRAHVARPELYDAADELGMLVWQDLPLQGRMARTVRNAAVRMARDIVDGLGHHPSIAVWCAHDDPAGEAGRPAPVWSRRQQLPSWNRTVLDAWVRRALETADESRPVIAHSGVAPHLPQLDGTDAHLFFGWHYGRAADLAGFAASVPRMMRFVGAFGARSAPEHLDVIHPDWWPDLDAAAVDYGYDPGPFAHYAPPASFATYHDWQVATQRHQSDVLRRQIETLRRLKYAPTGGFCFLQWADPEPMIGFGILDHERRPKLAHQAVVDACRPVIVVADPLPTDLRPGDALAVDVHVVSDRRDTLEGARCTASLRWAGGHHDWSWQGDVPPDSCVRVATVQFVVPDSPGELWLDLSVEHGDDVASNRYESRVAVTRQ